MVGQAGAEIKRFVMRPQRQPARRNRRERDDCRAR
jgi:hypothetical protein